MIRNTLVTISTLLYVLMASAQDKPSVPVKEVTLHAGDSFSIDFPIKAKFNTSYPLRANLAYSLGGIKRSTGLEGFSCAGSIPPNGGGTSLQLICSLDRTTTPGDYGPIGPVHVMSQTGFPLVSGSSLPPPSDRDYLLRAPVVHLIPPLPLPPAPPRTFPDLGDGQLTLTANQALAEGALQADFILQDLNRALAANFKSTRKNREYLLYQTRAARTVLQIAEDRFAKTPVKGSLPADPLFFKDFELRLAAVAKMLGATLATTYGRKNPHLVLVQLPSATDSIEAKASVANLDPSAQALAVVVTDMAYGFRQIAETNSESFYWSLITIPSGAEIYYSSLSHAETKWAGRSDQKHQQLPYARWTFRVSWNGCSKTETPDPFVQSAIEMTLTREGCQVK